MYDRCVAGDILRTVMSSIMRRRRGLIVAIGYLLSGGLGFDNHNPQTGDLRRKHSFPRQRVSSIAPYRYCGRRVEDGPPSMRLRRSRFAEERIIGILREQEEAAGTAEVCRKLASRP